MSVANTVLMTILLLLITVIGLRAMVLAEDESGRFAGAALLAIVVTIFALFVAHR